MQLGRPPVHGPGHHLHWPALHLHRAGGPGGRCTSDDMCRTLLLRQQGYRTALLQLTGPGLVTLGAALVLLRLLCCAAAVAKPGQAEVTCVVEQIRVYLHFQCEQYEHLLPEQVKEDDLKDVTLSNLSEVVDEKSNCTEDRKLQRQSGNIDQVIHIKVKEMERKEVILGTGMLTDP